LEKVRGDLVGVSSIRRTRAVDTWAAGASALLYLSTGISNLLQPAKAEVMFGQLSRI
jgi:hypothetical protein